jgi:hypothetical protein
MKRLLGILMNNKPTYDLDEIKELLLDEETRIISFDDQVLAASIGYPDEESIVARVQQIKHFGIS